MQISNAKHLVIKANLLLIILLLLSSQVSIAQNQRKVIRQGKDLAKRGFHLKALQKFNSLINKDSSNAEVNLLATACYLELDEPKNALKLINRSLNGNKCLGYYKALAYYKLENFEESKRLLQEFEENPCDHHQSKEDLEKLISSASATYEDSKGFIVRNFGTNINSKDREYCGVMLNKFDSVLFTSRRAEDHAAIAYDGMSYESIYITSVNENQNWSKPKELNLDIQSNRNHNATVQVTEEGKEIIIFLNGDLYLAKKINEKWVEQQRLSVINTGYNETHCFLTADQSTIYFSSDYFSDDNNLDLFVTNKTAEGKWSKPEPIIELNTPYDEDAPFISKDGTFYFSSRGHNSIGGFDVFSTRFDEKSRSWAPIINLGHPVNTVADDIYFSTYGKVGYITSSRLEGEGMLDLYQVLLFNKIKLKGKITQELDDAPVPGATVDVTYGHWFLRGYSDYEGNYEMYVPINKHMQVSIHKDTAQLLKGNYIVKISFGNRDVNEYNFNANMDLYDEQDPSLSSNIINLSDTVTINLKVKNDLQTNMQIRGISASREKEWLDSLNSLYHEKHIQDSLLMKPEPMQSILIEDSILMKVHFEFDSFELTDSAIINLKEFIGSLALSDYDQIEIRGYTDAVGADRYNQVLSIRRAQAVSNYLIDYGGIPIEKMLVKGLGEKTLIENKETASRINRRVELIVKRITHTARDY